MIDFLSGILTDLTSILLIPFRELPPVWGLLWLSLLAGAGMILIFKAVSDQAAIEKLRKKMGSQALGMLLFISNPLTVLGLAGRLLLSNFVYLWLILKPMAVIAVPFVILMGQLDARYSRAPLSAETDITVTLAYENDLPDRNLFKTDIWNGQYIGPPVFIPELSEISFRIRPGGSGIIIMETGGLSFPIGPVAEWAGAISVREYDMHSPFSRLLHPWNIRPDIIAETPNTPVGGSIDLPERRFHTLGGRWSWLAVLLVFSGVSATAGAVIFKVRV